MALTQLNVINAMLSSTGMDALTAQDTQHPRYIQALAKLTEIDGEFQNRGWWFNRSAKTLLQNQDGEVVYASNAVHVDPLDRTKLYVMRGLKLYNLTDATFNIGSDVDVTIIFQLPFDELPPLAASYLLARARHDYYLDQDGSNPKLERYAQMAQTAWVNLRGEHLKNADVNFFDGAHNIWFRTASHISAYPTGRQPTT